MLETREGVRDSRSLNVAIRGGQGVDDVEIDVVGGAVVGVVDNNIRDFGSRIGDIVKVDGDVVAGPACAFGGPTQRLFLCFTCPAITVVTVILRALDRVRGRALGWLGPGSPKSQPHQALVLCTAVGEIARGIALNLKSA